MAADMSAEEEIKVLPDKLFQVTQETTQMAQENTQVAQENTRLTQELNRVTQKNTQVAQETTRLTQENNRLKQRITPLTFTNLLTSCHQEIAEVRVEPDSSSCTTGQVDDPHDKLVPLALRVGTEFPALQESTFRKVCAIYDQCKEPPATFPSPETMKWWKRKGTFLGSELGLRRQQADWVEDMVKRVIKDLINERELPDDFKLGSDIRMENHANDLAKDEAKILSDTSAHKSFIRKVEGGAKRLAVIIEYKPPHKLSIETLKAGLKDLDILETIHRLKISIDKTSSYIENSETAVAIVIAQVYTYMIDSGIQYAYLTTGEAFVFLYTQEQDRNTLYYHLVIPKDVTTNGTDNWISYTAIGQVLSFYILACGWKLYDQDSRFRHEQQAHEWVIDDDWLTTSGETPALVIQAKDDDSDDPPDGGDSRAPSDPFSSASTPASRLSKGTSSQSTDKASQKHNETSSSSRSVTRVTAAINVFSA